MRDFKNKIKARIRISSAMTARKTARIFADFLGNLIFGECMDTRVKLLSPREDTLWGGKEYVVDFALTAINVAPYMFTNSRFRLREAINHTLAIGAILAIDSDVKEEEQFFSLAEAVKTPDQVRQLFLQPEEKYPLTVISDFINLEMLDLTAQGLTVFPKELTRLPKLRQISLANNPLLDWEDTFEKLAFLPSLEKVDLKNNRLRNLPDSIKNLLTIKEIYLNNNEFTQIPKNLFHFYSLNFLDLGDNRLGDEKLPWDHLDRLERLVLTSNQLSTPDFSGISPKLRFLDLSNNLLSQVPNALFNLNNLEVLNLNLNALTELPEDIIVWQNMKALSYFYNEIKVRPQALRELKNLQRMRLPEELHS